MIRSKYHQIFTRLDMCIGIMKIWFRIANRLILSVLDRVICPSFNADGVLLFHVLISKLFENVIWGSKKFGDLLNEKRRLVSFLLLSSLGLCFLPLVFGPEQTVQTQIRCCRMFQ